MRHGACERLVLRMTIPLNDVPSATKTVERWVPPHPLPNFNYIVAKARRARFSASEPHDAGMYKLPDISAVQLLVQSCTPGYLMTRTDFDLQASLLERAA